jgi:hypothetical protein
MTAILCVPSLVLTASPCSSYRPEPPVPKVAVVEHQVLKQRQGGHQPGHEVTGQLQGQDMQQTQ